MTNCSAIAFSSSDTDARPPIYKAIGIILAVSSGLFIGTSFIFKKLGLLKANIKYSEEAGEGYGYLKNAWWWTGMTMMIIGEICNFVAYAFVDAILVTPLGALSVVITTVLSAIFLKERLSFVGKVGCFLTIIGTVIICVNSPAQATVNTIEQMQCYVISPGFLTYAGIIIAGSVVIALWAGPRYGKKSMLVYLSVCSLIGGLSVVATQGLGAAILTQIRGTPQFNHWFLYVLLVFVICTLLTEIIYLNKALNIFNAALVTPTYYVYFTSATIVASAILFRGFKGTPIQILTIVLGFFTICSGVVLLQLSKSSKDMPDAKVFSGDLDQVRTVAEQEEHEWEPKADTIRGTASLIRSISKARRGREAAEAIRIHTERMEPIAENEHVEWEGLRRRKTVLEPGQQGPLPRRRTIHPPLGMSSNSTLSNDYHNLDEAPNTSSPSPHPQRHTTFLTNILTPSKSRRTTSMTSSGRSISFSSNPDSSASHVRGKSPVPLTEMSATAHNNANTPARNTSSASTSTLGPPPTYASDIDTSYHGPNHSSTGVHFTDSPPSRSDTSSLHSPPAPPPHARRAYSFQNFFTRSSHPPRLSSTHVPHPDSAQTHPDDRPNTATSGNSGHSFIFSRRRRTSSGTHPLAAVTEEERLGLVVGDSKSPSESQSQQQQNPQQQQQQPPPTPQKEPPPTPSKSGFNISSRRASQTTPGTAERNDYQDALDRYEEEFDDYEYDYDYDYGGREEYEDEPHVQPHEQDLGGGGAGSGGSSSSGRGRTMRGRTYTPTSSDEGAGAGAGAGFESVRVRGGAPAAGAGGKTSPRRFV